MERHFELTTNKKILSQQTFNKKILSMTPLWSNMFCPHGIKKSKNQQATVSPHGIKKYKNYC